MTILGITPRLLHYLERRGLKKQFEKKKMLFENNPFHPGLETEILGPRHLRVYSFRISQKYRAIFIYLDDGSVEIIDINNHYR
ncbi:MAG: hypothetical protein Q8P56_03185 [Candidatus Uhrbacteria bacterium]|nr:hypothetical protein [Candidatus Uhrbacteria bacterium]